MKEPTKGYNEKSWSEGAWKTNNNCDVPAKDWGRKSMEQEARIAAQPSHVGGRPAKK